MKNEKVLTITKCTQIESWVTESVQKGIFKPHQKLPAERQLSKELGASHMTVNKALSNLVTRGILYREQGKGTFVAGQPGVLTGETDSPHKRLVKKMSVGTDVLVVGKDKEKEFAAEGYWACILYSFRNYLGQFNMNCKYVSQESFGRKLPALRNKLAKREIGFVIFGEPEIPLLEDLSPEKRSAIVFISTRQRGFKSICPDDKTGIRMIVDHLVALKHRRIGFIGGPRGNYSAEQRYTAYREALQDHNLPFDGKLVTCGDLGNWKDGYEGVSRLISGRRRQPTALICFNDNTAAGAVAYLQLRGSRVPDDMSVTGFDGLEVGRVHNLTTVYVSREQIGSLAAAMVFEGLSSGTPPQDVVSEITVPVTLVKGASTGICKRPIEFMAQPKIQGGEERIERKRMLGVPSLTAAEAGKGKITKEV